MSTLTAGQTESAITPRLLDTGAGQIVAHAAGKVNLTLAVGPLRRDGYHEFESLMCTIALYDRLEFQLVDQVGIQIQCNDPAVPCDGRNLVSRAAELLGAAAGVKARLTVKLDKSIPVQAGLGGGSADAAATLLALNRLWELNWSGQRLSELARQLGSDVPFFLFGPTALCSGRGEQVQPLQCQWQFWAVIVKPPISLSTKEVYDSLEATQTSLMGKSAELAAQLANGKPSQIAPLLFNAMECPAFRIAEQLKHLQIQLQQLTAGPVRLCGSGSALFALFDSAREAQQMHHRLRRYKYPDLKSWVVTNNIW